MEYHLLAEMESTLARRFKGARRATSAWAGAVGRCHRRAHAKALARPRWSPRALERALQHALPSLAWLREDAHARRFASAYLRLIRASSSSTRWRTGSLGVPAALRPQASCYPRTESLLAALAFLNARAEALRRHSRGRLRVYQADL